MLPAFGGAAINIRTNRLSRRPTPRRALPYRTS
jgi:hypothetical protein